MNNNDFYLIILLTSPCVHVPCGAALTYPVITPYICLILPSLTSVESNCASPSGMCTMVLLLYDLYNSVFSFIYFICLSPGTQKKSPY